MSTSNLSAQDQTQIEAALRTAQSLSSYTDQDWAKSIQEASKHIQPSDLKIQIADLSPATIAQTIDHTLLKLDATSTQIETLCAEAKEHGFKSVCVRLPFVPLTTTLLPPSILTACVIGFHEGIHSTLSKLTESHSAVLAGAYELDVVLNYPSLIAGSYTSIFTELAAIRTLCPSPTVLKLIFETSQLDGGQIRAACHLAAAAGWDFVKTSTGFNGRGASAEDVKLMRAAAVWYASGEGRSLLGKAGEKVGQGPQMKVKASGGVRTFADAVAMLEIGAERIGASSGVKIVQEAVAGKSEGSGTGDGY